MSSARRKGGDASMNAPVRFRVVFGVLCIFLFLFSALPVQAADPPDPADFQVILFENPYFEGGSMGHTYDNELPDLNRWNLPTGEKWNDRVSSLAVGKNARAILYQHAGFGGPSIIFEGNGVTPLLVPDLHSIGWSDRISAIRVLDGLGN